MTTQTLAELAKVVNNDLVGGVAEDIITVNPVMSVIPFYGYSGDAVAVNRENALGDAGVFSVGGTINTRTPSTRTKSTFTATKIIGQVDMDDLVAGQAQSAGVDLTAQEIASKAKSISREFQDQMYSGDGSSPNMNSLHSLVDSSQYTATSAGQDLSFELLDELCDLVTAKDGQVDWLMGNKVQLRKFKALYRALGGADPTTVVIELPSGEKRTVLTYEGIPFFRNDWITSTETANGAAITGGALTSVFAGVWDDGSRKIGCAGIYPESFPAGISVKMVGTAEDRDEDMWRVRWYTNFAIFNRRGVARLTSLNA